MMTKTFAAVAALAAVSATGALANGDAQLIVSQHGNPARTIAVSMAGVDMDNARHRQNLDIRIERAARQVCDVNGGSKLDTLPDARACMADARAGAEQQLAAMGHGPALALR